MIYLEQIGALLVITCKEQNVSKGQGKLYCNVKEKKFAPSKEVPL